MKRSWPLLVSLLLCICLGTGAFAADSGSIVIDCQKPGATIGPLFYGLMTEEINHSYDGGLYAELVQNRIFQDADKPVAWSAVGDGAIAIDTTNPVNTVALTRSLRLDVNSPGSRAGIANYGFWGIPVWPNTKYHASFYARGGDGSPLAVTIESRDGNTVFASATVPAITNDWKKYDVDLTTQQSGPSTANRLVISTNGKGPIWFSLVSLFPPTYHDRANGNRIDIMQKLADLHPSFLRFPGGNFLEGDTIATRFDWKKTIGPLENRPGHMGCWSYHVSDGMGLLEFLDWCEDLKMEPLLAVYDGYSLQQQHVNPGPDLEPFIQDDLDEIEYCTGDVSTTWGKRRAEDGHPQPFKIHYVEIGNEDWFDHSKTYDGRFTQAFKAIKAKYPDLKCIATARVVHSCTPDLYDDHDYPSPAAMLRSVHRYDHYNPNDPKVFMGEWATQDGAPTPTMRAALCDAAWLTGLQKDSDTVQLNCYAPLLANVNKEPQPWPSGNKKGWEWGTNLIGYNAVSTFGSPSYYAQAMFAKAWGDTNLPTTITVASQPALPKTTGAVGVGTWHSTAEFKDLTVTQGDKTLLDSQAALKAPKSEGGQWETDADTIKQTDAGAETRMVVGDKNWSDYTIHVKARKTGGDEGFLILFHCKDNSHFGWFNVGGWGNTRSAVEIADGGRQGETGTGSSFTVEDNKWYDIRIELNGTDVKCFIDDKQVSEAKEPTSAPADPVFAVASRDQASGDIILKVVNTLAVPQSMNIKLDGVESVGAKGSADVLTGDPSVQNTIDNPTRIAPETKAVVISGPTFAYEFAPSSVTVLHIPQK